MQERLDPAIRRAATQWLIEHRTELDPAVIEDPALLSAVIAKTGLSDVDVYVALSDGWSEIAQSFESRKKSIGGAIGARLLVEDLSKPSIAHPGIPNVTIVRLDDTSWLGEGVLVRTQAKDKKGRTYGSPRNPGVPPLSSFNPRWWEVRAGDLGDLIKERQHGQFPEQAAVMRERTNEELLAFNDKDPMSALELPGGMHVTGGHHRTYEIIDRVADGRMSPDTTVRILVHD